MSIIDNFKEQMGDAFDKAIKDKIIDEAGELDFDKVLNRVKEEPNLDFDFFIIFKEDNCDDARKCCTGHTLFTVELKDIEVTFDGKGVVLNPKKSIQDPVELLENLKDNIDYIFA